MEWNVVHERMPKEVLLPDTCITANQLLSRLFLPSKDQDTEAVQSWLLLPR